MKKVLKFSGLIALVFGLVAFILIMASHSLIHAEISGTWFSGISAVFGGGRGAVLGYEGNVDAKLAWTALIAWILILVAMIILLAGVILPLLKVKALDKFAGVLNLVAVCSLVVAGILIFLTVPVFKTANELGDAKYNLGGGYIAGGILAIVGGLIAILPDAVDFIGKKK